MVTDTSIQAFGFFSLKIDEHHIKSLKGQLCADSLFNICQLILQGPELAVAIKSAAQWYMTRHNNKHPTSAFSEEEFAVVMSGE